MQVKCPACNASFSLEAALALDAGRSALLAALAMPAPLAQLMSQYLGMFRASGRALAFYRIERLLSDLEPMLTAGIVTRDGYDRPCSLAVWQEAFEEVISARDNGKLRLPLKSHGYLLEIAATLAEQAAAKAEREREEQRKHGRQRDSAPTPSNVERGWLISDTRAALDLGVITREDAEQKLAAAGINPEVLNGR